ncbi:hypothetical protein BT93_A0648 [Corymbia citriodora subsp. variegata]|nr:hypothetical protein BT93_A0648 [Corymbia citriodora subsp. variegata]
MNTPIMSWLVLAISTISIFSDVARASASTQCLGVDQRSLLLELRNSLVYNASFSSELVYMTCEDGLVMGLDLSDESIFGGFDGSSSFFRLEFLRSLNLAFNDFNSTAIPLGLANFSRLEHLNLSHARFTDFVFLKLEKSNLRSLIGDLGKLRELYLDWVNISAEGSEWCDALFSSVQKLEVLSMSYCYLSGPVDASLMSLANSSVIQLDFKNLSTTVPSFLANFSSLKTLSLWSCGLQGEFPQEVFQLQTLQNLIVSKNELLRVSVPDFPKDSSLETLALWGTNISRRIPDSIGNLRKLLTLDLSGCSLSQITSVGWEDLLNLEILDLRNNSLEGDIPPTLFILPRLLVILLSSNRFNGQLIIYPNVSSCQLQSLHLGRNLLYTLSLSHNNFSGSINIDVLWGLGNLTDLDLSYSGLSINSMAFASVVASSFPEYNYLYLVSCQLQALPCNNITCVIPNYIGDHLSTSMRFFSLSKNNFHGFILKSICKLSHLEVLDLSHNHLNGTIPNCLMMASLKVLNMRNNYLSGNLLRGQIPLSLANCMTLEIANIGDNQIDRTFPCHFMAMSSLRVLILRSNKLYGEIGCPHSPCTWHMLQIIDLSSNDFDGMLPAGRNIRGRYYQDTVSVTFKSLKLELVKILTVFTLIDFSSNRFEGPIPNTLRDFKALYFLNLSHNAISDFLSFLNLSNNQLVGSIPDNNHFLTLSKSSFKGNPGLCGFALNKSCSITMNRTEHGKNDSDGGESINFQFILVGLEFGAGAAVVVAALTFWKTRQVWYDDQVDKLFEVVLPKTGLTFTRHLITI